jgi:hypothetical protein
MLEEILHSRAPSAGPKACPVRPCGHTRIFESLAGADALSLLLVDSMPRNGRGHIVDCAQGKLRRHDHLRSNLEMAGHKLYRTDAQQAEFAANRWNRSIRGHAPGSTRCTRGSAADKANPPANPSARQKMNGMEVSWPRHSTKRSHNQTRPS